MAIRINTIDGLGLPDTDKYISIQGSWGSAPTGGGIITFSGSASAIDKMPAGGSLNGQLNLGALGTFYVVSKSEDTYLGYKKYNYSLSCILGYLTKTKATVPLGLCVYEDGTVADLVRSISMYLGITINIPRRLDTQLFEPVWLREGQTLIDLLNEILVATGCILYSPNGTSIECQTISQFYRGLSGNSNANTISRNFSVQGGGSEVSYIEVSGAKQIREYLPKEETVSSGTGRNFSEESFGKFNSSTTIKREFPMIGSQGIRRITTTTINGEEKTKSVVIEEFEPQPQSQTRFFGRDINIMECFPYDPGRILKRITTNYEAGSKSRDAYFAALQTIADICGYEKTPLAPYSSGAYVKKSEETETWEYNTQEPIITNNPDNYVPKAEKVSYSRVLRQPDYYVNNSFLDFTYGQQFDFIQDDPDRFFNNYRSRVFNVTTRLNTVESEIIIWNKHQGSYRWVGERFLYESRLKTRYDVRKAAMEYCYKIYNDEFEDDDPQKRKEALERYLTALGVGFAINISDSSSLEANFNSFVKALESTNQSMDLTFSESKADWEPNESSFPAPYKVYDVPWKIRDTAGSSSTNTGEVVTMQVGKFSTTQIALEVSREIRNAKKQRLESLSVTNINEIFKVGFIDSPSFSISVDGVQSSGVYFNG